MCNRIETTRTGTTRLGGLYSLLTGIALALAGLAGVTGCDETDLYSSYASGNGYSSSSSTYSNYSSPVSECYDGGCIEGGYFDFNSPTDVFTGDTWKSKSANGTAAMSRGLSRK